MIVEQRKTGNNSLTMGLILDIDTQDRIKNVDGYFIYCFVYRCVLMMECGLGNQIPQNRFQS